MISLGHRLDIDGTPSVFVNGRPVRHPDHYTLWVIVNEELSGSGGSAR